MAEPFPCWGEWAFRRSLRTTLAPKDVKQCILYLWYFIVIRVRWKEAEIYRYLCQWCSESQRNPSKSGCEFRGSAVAPRRSQTALINCLRHKIVKKRKTDERWQCRFIYTEIPPDCVTGNLRYEPHNKQDTIYPLPQDFVQLCLSKRSSLRQNDRAGMRRVSLSNHGRQNNI